MAEILQTEFLQLQENVFSILLKEHVTQARSYALCESLVPMKVRPIVVDEPKKGKQFSECMNSMAQQGGTETKSKNFRPSPRSHLT